MTSTVLRPRERCLVSALADHVTHFLLQSAASSSSSMSSRAYLEDHGFVEHSTSFSPAERNLAKTLQAALPRDFQAQQRLFSVCSVAQGAQPVTDKVRTPVDLHAPLIPVSQTLKITPKRDSQLKAFAEEEEKAAEVRTIRQQMATQTASSKKSRKKPNCPSCHAPLAGHKKGVCGVSQKRIVSVLLWRSGCLYRRSDAGWRDAAFFGGRAR